MAKALVVQGNPVDGFIFIGPFPDKDAAIEWCEEVAIEPDWWIAECKSSIQMEREWNG